ncbi:hypothetical protein D083_2259 [Dickeya solani RNS 08.23.3.1.A]|nr:hypothetical protein D083_2259 [Dickeya solani RNS 08.23.3.1.A]
MFYPDEIQLHFETMFYKNTCRISFFPESDHKLIRIQGGKG